MNSSSNKLIPSYKIRHNNKFLNNKRKSESSTKGIQKELQDIFKSVVQKLPNINESTEEQDDLVIEITDNEDYKSETESDIEEYFNKRELLKHKKVMPLETQYKLISDFENEFKIGYSHKQELLNRKKVTPLEITKILISHFENEFKIKPGPTDIKLAVTNNLSLTHEEMSIIAPKKKENTLSIPSKELSAKEQTTTVDTIHSNISVNSNLDSLIIKSPVSVQSKPTNKSPIASKNRKSTIDSIESKSPSTIDNKNSEISTQIKSSSGQKQQNFLVSNQFMLYLPVNYNKLTKSMTSIDIEQPNEGSSIKSKDSYKTISTEFEKKNSFNSSKIYKNEQEEDIKLEEGQQKTSPVHLRELHFEQKLKLLREQYLQKLQKDSGVEKNNTIQKEKDINITTPGLFQTPPIIPMNREQILKSNYSGYPNQSIIKKPKTDIVCNPTKIKPEIKNVNKVTKSIPSKKYTLVQIPRVIDKSNEKQKTLSKQNEEINPFIKQEIKEDDNDNETSNNLFQLNFDVNNSNNFPIDNNKDDIEYNPVELQSMFFY